MQAFYNHLPIAVITIRVHFSSCKTTPINIASLNMAAPASSAKLGENPRFARDSVYF